MSLAELKPSAGRGVFVQKQRANVYTMMLIVSFLCIIVGCLFLYLEMKEYNFQVKVPAAAQMKTLPAAPAPAPPTGMPGT